MTSQRRYDLDWWRVISIFLVFLHHVGMPFNGDHFHIMNATSSKLLDDVMVSFEQCRLPLLFVISGTGTMFAFSKRTWQQFIKERALRLLIPLAFGVLCIVPPQTYYEHPDAYSSIWEAYYTVFTHLDVNHLWFIENLFYMSVAVVPFILWLRSSYALPFKRRLALWCAHPLGMFSFVLPLILIKVVSKIYFPDDDKSIDNLSNTLFYGYFLLSGMVITSNNALWDRLKMHRKINAVLALIALVLFYAYYLLPDTIASKYWSIPTRWHLWYGVSALLSWTIIITLLGYGQGWFNKKSGLLQKLNEAIYPFYILHQTVIIIIGFYIIQQPWPIGIKGMVLMLSSFVGICLVYRYVVYPFRITRFLFGMKIKKHT